MKSLYELFSLWLSQNSRQNQHILAPRLKVPSITVAKVVWQEQLSPLHPQSGSGEMNAGSQLARTPAHKMVPTNFRMDLLTLTNSI